MNRTQLAIFENASDAILISDAAQRIVFWNKKAEELLGYRAQDVVGKRCYKVVSACSAGKTPPTMLCQAFCAAADAASNGRAVNPTSATVQRPDGAETVITIEHTFLFPEPREQSDAFLVMHIFRPAADEANADHGLRIHLLGQTRVDLPGGRRLDRNLWKRNMVRALFALLVLNRPHGIHRDKILDLLWRDKEREAALANLNTTVYYLRRALQPDLGKGEQSRYIQIEGDLYRLCKAGEHWVDVDTFEESLSRARWAQPAEALALYENALSLYQGDYLADLDFAGGEYVTRREYFRERYLTGLRELAMLYESQGRERRAEELYRKILTHDEFEEDACRQAMRLMLYRGARADAIACFQRVKRRLKSELNLNPQPATVALYVQAMKTSPFSQTNGNNNRGSRSIPDNGLT